MTNYRDALTALDDYPDPACLIHDVSGEDVRGWEMADCTCPARLAETVSETVPTRHEAPDVAELRRLLDALPGFTLKHLHGGPGGESYIALVDEGGMPLPDSGFDAVLFFAEIAALEVPRLLDRLAHMAEARDNARAEVGRLAALVAEVRELHRESRGSLAALYPNPICECGKDYPCPTTRAIGSES